MRGSSSTRSSSGRSSRSRTCLVVIAIFVSIVSLSNVFIFHYLHEHVHVKVNVDSSSAILSNFSTLNHLNGHGGRGHGHGHGHGHVEKKLVEPKVEKEEQTQTEGKQSTTDSKTDSKTTTNSKNNSNRNSKTKSSVAGLSCADHGGPSDEKAEEMIFWSDIEEDSDYKSPFYDEEKYITFEPDHGGWNNIRMAMETILVLAHATGRTLVLPPKKGMYLLGKGKQKHDNVFSFNDFFHLDAIAMEHEGLSIITMDEFLKRKGVTGQLKSVTSGNVLIPPRRQTDWDGQKHELLWKYLESVGTYPDGWDPHSCVAVIPSSTDPKHVTEIQQMMETIKKQGKLPNPDKGDYDGEPTPVDAPTIDRLKEMLATRNKLCIYDTKLQQEQLIHFKVDRKEHARMLTHFYSFVFFQDWRQDLWSKRFVRDHIRYVDEIICAAARVVNAVREKAKSISTDNSNTKGTYNSFHVRRGDFQYKGTRLDANELYEKSKDELKEGSLLYIATDERDKKFFDPLTKYYKVSFMDDYMHLIKDVNPNYYGMLDQLIAYKGEVFFGTWFSTLTGYVNRMRGYYNAKHELEGYEKGIINSYYFTPQHKKFQMRDYRAVKLPLYMREFPVSWRDIDKGIGEL